MLLERLGYKGHGIRTYLFDGEIYWSVKDVFKALELEDYQSFIKNFPSSEQKMLWEKTERVFLISEPSLCQFIMEGNRLKTAQFREWFTRFGAPALRRAEKYVGINNMMDDPDAWVKLIRSLQQYKRSVNILENCLRIKDYKKDESIVVTVSNLPLRMFPTVLRKNGIKATKDDVKNYLRANEFMKKSPAIAQQDVITQKGMESGYLKKEMTEAVSVNGDRVVGNMVTITPEGQLFFIKEFLKIFKRES